MAIPVSGSLSICEAGLGTCRSIATAVTNTTSGSLATNSVCAGKSAPHCMREFYGYSPVSTINVYVGVQWVGVCGGGNGMGGNVQLKCGSTIVCQGNITTFTQGVCTFNWTNVPAGTYCVYGGNITAWNSYSQEPAERYWYSDTSSGAGTTTNTFNTNENVDWEIAAFI